MKKGGVLFILFTLFGLMNPVMGQGFDEEHVRKLEERIAEIESFLDKALLDEGGTFIRVGGAARIQYSYTDWDKNNREKLGNLALDTFRLNFSGDHKRLKFSSEYRYYPSSDWHGPHHAWVGYRFSENMVAQFGIHQVPFGLLPYASHNFWFSGAYYVGLEDDYDMGVKLLLDEENWEAALAFYKNEELGNSATSKRYSVDVLSAAEGGFAGAEDGGNEETNQVNVRLVKKFEHGGLSSTSLGVSAQAGQLYNKTVAETGDHWAAAAHLNGNYGRWNLQLQWARYQKNPKHPAGVQDQDTVTMGAYASSWGVPNEADIGIANASYTYSFDDLGPVQSLTFYLDNTWIKPEKERFDTIWQNVAGAIVVAGPVFTYFDVISGKNMIFSGGEFVNEVDEGRTTRFNLNVGYYF